MKFISTCRKYTVRSIFGLQNGACSPTYVCSATENYDHKWKSLTSITTDSVDKKLLQIGKLQQTIWIWIAQFTRVVGKQVKPD